MYVCISDDCMFPYCVLYVIVSFFPYVWTVCTCMYVCYGCTRLCLSTHACIVYFCRYACAQAIAFDVTALAPLAVCKPYVPPPLFDLLSRAPPSFSDVVQPTAPARLRPTVALTTRLFFFLPSTPLPPPPFFFSSFFLSSFPFSLGTQPASFFSPRYACPPSVLATTFSSHTHSSNLSRPQRVNDITCDALHTNGPSSSCPPLSPLLPFSSPPPFCASNTRQHMSTNGKWAFWCWRCAAVAFASWRVYPSYECVTDPRSVDTRFHNVRSVHSTRVVMLLKTTFVGCCLWISSPLTPGSP